MVAQLGALLVGPLALAVAQLRALVPEQVRVSASFSSSVWPFSSPFVSLSSSRLSWPFVS